MAKNTGDGCVEAVQGCVVFVLIGIVVFAGCSMDGDSESTNSDSPASATTQSAKPNWILQDEDVSGHNDTLWIDMYKSVEYDLLEGVSAQDINSESFSLDDLDDDEGLTAADVEAKLLSKPKYGTAKFDKDGHTVTYTPRSDFRGTDEIRYSLKLKGKPWVAEATYSITVELSPGGRYYEQQSQEPFENCAAARAAGAAPVRRGEPGYSSHLDRDSDGIGCEWG
ncbi:excalibur calcium-binding domain-containing protein [Streptomyces sp. NPDC006197]|uniref:excalibur calcium-binding domain-containing protein n=1 Tax=Streptomyces sp. NPDC006197 TaxID=3156685 RepID=UPI00339F7D99